MDKETTKKKLILAVLQGDDYADTVDELNRGGFFATVLSSTGGFLKKKSMTLMIGVETSAGLPAAERTRGGQPSCETAPVKATIGKT